jgi:hypothetical protein
MRVVLVYNLVQVEVVEQVELEQMLIQERVASVQLPTVLNYWLSDMEHHLLCLLHQTQLYQVE